VNIYQQFGIPVIFARRDFCHSHGMIVNLWTLKRNNIGMVSGHRCNDPGKTTGLSKVQALAV
jgi:hypothetical protein